MTIKTNQGEAFYGNNLEENLYAQKIISFLNLNYNATISKSIAEEYKDIAHTNSVLYVPEISIHKALSVLHSIFGIAVERSGVRMMPLTSPEHPYFFTCKRFVSFNQEEKEVMTFAEFLIFLQVAVFTNRVDFFKQHKTKRFVTMNRSLKTGELLYVSFGPFIPSFSKKVPVVTSRFYETSLNDLFLVKEIKKHPI